MASDDEDERLAHFLEYDLLSEDSDLEELETVEREHKMKGTQDGKRHRVQVDVFSEDEEKERQEAKKIRVEAGEISDEGLSRAIGSCSPQSLLPSELESEVEDAASHPKESDIAETSKNSGKRSAENKQEESDIAETSKKNNGKRRTENKQVPRRIQTGIFSQIPPELLYNILKFLSSEDLVSCSLVCRFMNFIAADETLWRRLYCMRWGLLPPKKVRECAWKKLYIQRDEEDMAYFVRHCPSEFKEYYIQMQVAKRSQAPHPSQVKDDRIVLDKTVADQVSMWKSSKGLNETVVENHACSGNTCTYYQIGNAFVCEKTGNVHVCDDACKEIVMDRTDELLVCTISGRCFENIDNRPLSATEVQLEAEQAGSGDEAEPFMGSGLFGRAYILGYNCEDERELDDALRFC